LSSDGLDFGLVGNLVSEGPKKFKMIQEFRVRIYRLEEVKKRLTKDWVLKEVVVNLPNSHHHQFILGLCSYFISA
jgi:hypothetical protein